MRPHGIGCPRLIFFRFLTVSFVPLFALAQLLLAQPSSAPNRSLPALTTALQVKHLTSEEAKANRPVLLRGIVLYYNQQDFVDLIIHDGSAGIYLADTKNKRFRTTPGDVIEVEGFTGAGDYAPVVHVSTLRIVGTTPLPAPREVSYQQFTSGVEDAEWVQIRGIIRTATPSRMTPPGALQLDLMTNGGRLNARVLNYDPARIAGLVDSEALITGVCTPVFNNRRQLLDMRLSVPTAGHIEILQPAPADPFALPTRPINALRQYEPKSTFGHRVKVRGTVMLRDKGRLFIRDDTQGLRIATTQGGEVAIGDEVEVVGFVARGGYSPMLEDATYRPTGATHAIAPMEVTLAQAREGRHDCDLVQLDGVLLEWIPNPAEYVLLLQQDNVVFRAHLPRVDPQFATLPLQSRVRATGICVTELGPQRRPQSFRLLLRSPADLQVLEWPSWWNPRRLAWALGGLTLIVLAASVWVVLLRRQVATQTTLIGKKIHQEAILHERHRMAREIHDTLVQGFAAISLQLEAIRDKLAPDDTGRVARHLGIAHRLARESLAEARRSIWALHNIGGTEPNLAASLAASCKSITDGTGIENSVAIEGELPLLTAEIENNLLYIGREALINSVKHAAPKRIQLTLRREPSALHVIVRDDGRGFERVPAPGAADCSGFGMISMEERALQIRATLQIESRCGAGTTVCVTVPLNAV